MRLNTGRAEQVFIETGLDALVATSPENVAYVSEGDFASMRSKPGVRIYAILAARDTSHPTLVLPAHEVDPWAEAPGPVLDVEVYGTVHREIGRERLLPEEERIRRHAMGGDAFPSPLPALASMLSRMGLASSRIGIDESRCSFLDFDRLRGAVPDAKFTAAGDLFQHIRMVKTVEEVALLRRSAAITSSAIEATFATVSAGVTESELATAFRTSVAREDGVPSSWLISIGRRTGRTHTRQANHAIAMGDLVKIDAGATVSMYWSDLARTRVLGDPSPEYESLYQSLVHAVKSGVAAVRPGTTASQIFDVAVNAARDAGLSSYDRHMVGHGIGITPYDPPIIKRAGTANIYGIAEVDAELEPGMVLNIETPYYRLGEAGLIVEDTCLVTESGTELLSDGLSYSFVV